MLWRLSRPWLLLALLSALPWLPRLWAEQPLTLNSDLRAMVPRSSDHGWQQLAEARLSERFEQQLLLLLGHPQASQAVAAARQLQQALAGQPLLTVVNGSDSGREWGQRLFAHRFHLLSPQQRELLNQDGLAPLQARWQQQLARPLAPISTALLEADPWLLASEAIISHSPATAQLRLEQGVPLISGDGQQWAVVVLTHHAAAFDPDAQLALLQPLEQALATLPATIRVKRAGLLFHAAASTKSAQREMRTIGLGSMLGVLLLLWLCLRSLQPLLLAAAMMACGLSWGLAVSWQWFGELQLLTLVFGASLIGVAVDYSTHLFCDQQASGASLRHCLGRIAPALTMGLASSVLAYLAMLLLPFPGLQQMALFCAVGLLASAAAMALVALTSDARMADTSISRRLRQQRWQLPRWLWLALLVVAAIGCLRLTSNDDLRRLHQGDAALVASEARIRALLQRPDSAFVLLTASDDEQLRQREEQLAERLAALKPEPQLTTLASLLPSTARQQADYQRQQRLYDTAGQQALAALGLDPGAIASAAAAYQQAQPLTRAALAGSPLWQQWQWLQLESKELKGVASIALIGGGQPAAIGEAVATLAGARYIDPVGEMSHNLGFYRLATLGLLALAALMATLVLGWNLGWRPALRLVAVPLAAALITLGLLGWLGQPLSLFHSLGLLLVFGIGMDYALFHHHGGDDPHGSDTPVWLATTLALISTLLSFGLLAFSQTPALAHFGLTVAVGILTSFLLAPSWCRRPAFARQTPQPAIDRSCPHDC